MAIPQPSRAEPGDAALRRRVRELGFLNELSAAVSGELDLGQLLKRALASLSSLTGVGGGAVLLRSEDDDMWLAAEHGLPAPLKRALAGRPPSVGEGIPGIAAERCELLIVADSCSDERELPEFRAYGVRTHVCIPLSVRGRALGVLGLIDRQRHTFDAEDLALFNSAGQQLGVAIERANLFEEARQRVRLEERARLAREIHDSLAQALTGIIIRLEDAEGLTASRPERARAEIQSACVLARQSLEEARRSVWELQPLALAAGGITAAITRELRTLQARGLETALESPADASEWLDERIQLVLYRVAQEALNNVSHHARATRVTVGLSLPPGDVRLVVSDDGVGFDPTDSDGPLSRGEGRFGLMSMQERARLAGGRLTVRSAPGIGTEIAVQIPLRPVRVEPPLPATSPPPAADRIRVLVVDDHEVVRQGIRRMLEADQQLVVVGEAADGEAAIEQIGRLAPDVSLIDVRMPGLDGVATVRRLRELGIDQAVILISTYAKDDYIFEGLAAGARGYLLKDASRSDLVQAIRTVHSGSSLLQPVIARRLFERGEARRSAGLTRREFEVLRALASGAQDKQIAAALGLTIRTVKFHVRNIYTKLDVHNRTEAVRLANDRGLLDLGRDGPPDL